MEGSLLCSFTPATTTEVNNAIMKYANKSCELDPVPTWLVKKCLPELLPLITGIINTSLQTGNFPSTFKKAIIRPILKKSNLDPEEMKNYRPISNLHFISKILEKIVSNRIEDHLLTNDLHDPLQSAYRTAHSTETALLKVNNDILASLDKGQCTLLASLDLSAAFDTVDHAILITRLRNTYGIRNSALAWFESYLDNRQHQISINSSLSQTRTARYGVPQGSVLGARMYTMYTKPLSVIFNSHDVRYHAYADDTQVYIQCDNSPTCITHALARLGSCIEDACAWMKINALKLNETKTEFIVFSRNGESSEHHLCINDTTIPPTKTIKNLGISLDCTMTLEHQISAACRSTNYQLRKIKYIRRYLTNYALQTLVQSTALPKLDYCNSLYAGLPQKSTRKLQLVQNSAARIITGTARRDHITPILYDLNWLPITKKCQHKLLVLTYKALHDAAPKYFCDMLDWYTPARSLRSESVPSLVPRRNTTVKYGKRLSDTSTAVIWNSLPKNIRLTSSLSQYKRLLKSYLLDN